MEVGGEHWKGSGLFPQYPSPPPAPDTHTQSDSVTQHVGMSALSKLSRTLSSLSVNQLYSLSPEVKLGAEKGLCIGLTSSVFMY